MSGTHPCLYLLQDLADPPGKRNVVKQGLKLLLGLPGFSDSRPNEKADAGIDQLGSVAASLGAQTTQLRRRPIGLEEGQLATDPEQFTDTLQAGLQNTPKVSANNRGVVEIEVFQRLAKRRHLLEQAEDVGVD
jgi:hypothetical protein